jgi:hypothetical protein
VFLALFRARKGEADASDFEYLERKIKQGTKTWREIQRLKATSSKKRARRPRILKCLTEGELDKLDKLDPLPEMPPESAAEGLTWAEMVKIEPWLARLLQRIERTDTSTDEKCRVVLWYLQHKPRMTKLVGHAAEGAPDRLRTRRAFDIAYQKLFYETPPCRCRGCNRAHA